MAALVSCLERGMNYAPSASCARVAAAAFQWRGCLATCGLDAVDQHAAAQVGSASCLPVTGR